jgi:hypothetical protein
MFFRSLWLVSVLALVATTNAPSVRRGALPASSSSAEQQTNQSNSEPAAAPTVPASDATAEVHFTGEVLHGQIYEHDIGHDMVFRLTPAVSDEGGGWVIGILPANEPVDDPIEFAEIATPPYHSYNERFLAAAAGYSAREAVAVTTRKFYFVQSVADEHLANEVVNTALYPSAASEAEKSRVALESGGIQLGSGELRIVHSRVTTGKGVPDTIAWVKFDVVVNFSPGITLQDVLAPKPPSKR